MHKFNQDREKFEQVTILMFILSLSQIFTVSPNKFVAGFVWGRLVFQEYSIQIDIFVLEILKNHENKFITIFKIFWLKNKSVILDI
jgi:hypothetical protein